MRSNKKYVFHTPTLLKLHTGSFAEDEINLKSSEYVRNTHMKPFAFFFEHQSNRGITRM